MIFLCNLKISVKTDDLSLGFDRDCERRQQALANNKNAKGKYPFRSLLEDVLGSAKHPERGTYGVVFNLTLTGNIYNDLLNKSAAPDVFDAKIVISGFDWYVRQSTPSMELQAMKSKQILIETPTKFSYVEKTVSIKHVKTEKLWPDELVSQQVNNIPTWIIVCFNKEIGRI